MSLQVLIVQSDEAAAQSLAKILAARGDQFAQAGDVAQALAQLEQTRPQVVFVDLHLPGNGCRQVLHQLSLTHPDTRAIVTNKYPDIQAELNAKEQGVRVFLRQPYTAQWVEQALERLAGVTKPGPLPKKVDDGQPRVRIPVRLKITVPYMLLALAFALVGAYLVSQFVASSIQDRFNNQLVGSGKQAADWMVQEETRRLQTLRLIANTEGVAEAVKSGNAEALRQLVLPHFINSQEEAFEILDTSGASVLSLHRAPGMSPG
ncbi:MAG: cache domain-containing protein, partial [Anaerolineaceae bacterium]|nr:cache domain-containing protein [Anaerolineaceae bacterium]